MHTAETERVRLEQEARALLGNTVVATLDGEQYVEGVRDKYDMGERPATPGGPGQAIASGPVGGTPGLDVSAL